MSKKIEPVNGQYILAEGEVTGHAHRVMGSILLYQEDNGTKRIETQNPFTVTHEEHKAVTVDDCLLLNSNIGIVQEYDHFKEEARKVAD